MYHTNRKSYSEERSYFLWKRADSLASAYLKQMLIKRQTAHAGEDAQAITIPSACC
jgi:hypothetical protein